MPTFTPSCVDLWCTGALQGRVEQAYARLAACDICSWQCGPDRQARRARSNRASRIRRRAAPA